MNDSHPTEPKHSSILKSLIAPALKFVRSGSTELAEVDRRRIVFSGLWGSAKAAVTVGLAGEINVPLFVLTATDAQAESFHQDLVCWLNLLGRPSDDAMLFPSTEILPYELTS
ncbi:MAG TPA: hypothetical protein VIL61_02410, partial [Nitrospiria bacterium]